MNAQGIEGVGKDNQHVWVDENGELPNSLDNILEGKIMAPN